MFIYTLVDGTAKQKDFAYFMVELAKHVEWKGDINKTVFFCDQNNIHKSSFVRETIYQ